MGLASTLWSFDKAQGARQTLDGGLPEGQLGCVALYNISGASSSCRNRMLLVEHIFGSAQLWSWHVAFSTACWLNHVSVASCLACKGEGLGTLSIWLCSVQQNKLQ